MSDFWFWALVGGVAYLAIVMAVLSVFQAGARADAWSDRLMAEHERDEREP